MARGEKRSKPDGKDTARAHTPVMQQFLRAKEQYPDAFVFFRLGDFYEMFFDDAVRVAELLDLALTHRGTDPSGNPIPMAGVPHHAATGYVTKLLAMGHKIALCEQMADPSTVKGVVPREVVRVITPGLCLEEDALDARSDSYLVAVAAGDSPADGLGLAAFELTTAQLTACALPDTTALLAELVRLDPREVLLPPALAAMGATLGAHLPRAAVRSAPPPAGADRALADVLDEAMHRELAAAAPAIGLVAAGIALAYAQSTQPTVKLSVQRAGVHEPRDHLVLDETAVRSLELVKTLGGERRGSLLHHLDRTKTPMGARMLRRRILAPLTDLAAIRRRHDAVEALFLDATLRGRVREALSTLGDLERMATRASLGVATPRDLGVVRRALVAAREVASVLASRPAPIGPDPLAGDLPEDLADALRERLVRTLEDELPTVDRQGGIFRAGVDAELDEARALSSDSKDVVQALEARERERTGIASLRVKYTRVFGYYIEITRSNLRSVPSDYVRKQTVANGERFVTDELAELEEKILSAEERALAREHALFAELRAEVARQAMRLRALASRLASLDVHAALADVAHELDYVRPTVDASTSLELVAARHPIVERLAAAGRFVPNDVRLDAAGARLMLVTGPNMAGKSTVMRQVALAVILAQMGGFVPATSARIGVVDRVYSRVGASDNLAEGQSTFMVEMVETAAILAGATHRSLVILDEIGRGTSTYDGLSIAWAVAEHLHDAAKCRAMFATHYHELCELAATREGIVTYNVAAEEVGEDIVFLHTLVPGAASRSYGVAVAKRAGLPPIVLARASAILKTLEAGEVLPSGKPARMRRLDAEGRAQLELFTAAPVAPSPSEVEATLRELDLDRMTPLDALVALARLRDLLK